MFITLEGPEGSGKTTVSKRIIEILKEKGYDLERGIKGSNAKHQKTKELKNGYWDWRQCFLLY